MGKLVPLRPEIPPDAVHSAIYGNGLDARELRNGNLEKYLVSVVVELKDGRDVYEATHYTALSASGPRVHLKSRIPLLASSFNNIEQIVLRSARGKNITYIPSPIGGFRQESDISIESPSQEDIADMVHRYEEGLGKYNVTIGQVFFQDVPHIDYLNSNIPSQKLRLSRIITFPR